MSTQKKLAILAMILMIAPLILTGCGPQPESEIIYETVIVEKEGETVVETVVVEKKVVVTETVEFEKEVEATPEMVARLGGWFDTVIFVGEPSTDMAITRLEVGDIDVYAPMVSEPDVARRIFESEGLAYETAYGGYDEITFMASSSPEFNDGRLNPFYSDKIREAMNWLIDRDYIAQEIAGGLAVPRYVPVNYASKDSALLADTIAGISLEYAHDPARQLVFLAGAGRETVAHRPDLCRDQSEPSEPRHSWCAQGCGGQPPVRRGSVLPGPDPQGNRQVRTLRLGQSDPAASSSRPGTLRHLEHGYDLQLPRSG